MMELRKAGILMPIFSLPSPYGIGTMGREARVFIDFLSDAGQSCWQMLPIGQTSYGDSPYQSFSSFAGNPYFIDLDELAGQGLLLPEEYLELDWGDAPSRVDYELQYRTRFVVLNKACRRLLVGDRTDFETFCDRNAYWLEDYALFMTIKEKNRAVCWFEWEEGERLRDPETLDAVRRTYADRISFWKAVQYLFFRQWDQLKAYAHSRGISIFGDLPIYTAADSADVWAAPEQFQLDASGRPIEVAGCPPDAFSEDGQLWGNPLFDWEYMKRDGYRWWLRRIGFQFEIYDTLRIDHFRGFESYYAIAYGEKTARNGRWRKGPGLEFFQAVERALGQRDIVAEDLGFLTEDVYRLLEDTGYPGMKVLEFAFSNPEEGSDYLPHTYPRHCVAYAGTHDNDTIQGWMVNASQTETMFAKDYLRLSEEEGYHWGMLRGIWASPADLAVVQLQDVLGLGTQARMNIPSTLGGNWQWRMLPGQCSDELAKKLRHDMVIYQRLPKKAAKSGSKDGNHPE